MLRGEKHFQYQCVSNVPSASSETQQGCLCSNALVQIMHPHNAWLTSVSWFMQVSYSRLIHGLQQENIQINRKVLSDLAIQEPFSFKALVSQVSYMRGASATAPPTA